MTHPPSEYFNIPFCKGQNGNTEKFKALGCLPCRESWVVAEFWKQRIARCMVDYSSHVVKSCKSEDLDSNPWSVTYSLRNIFCLSLSLFICKMNIQLEDHKSPLSSRSSDTLCPGSQGTRQSSLSHFLSMAYILLPNKALCVSEKSSFHSCSLPPGGVFYLENA